MKFISLTSYAPGQTFDHSEPQYTWLSQEFAKVCCCWGDGIPHCGGVDTVSQAGYMLLACDNP